MRASAFTKVLQATVVPVIEVVDYREKTQVFGQVSSFDR